MAGELIISEVTTPSTPSSGKDSIFISNDSTPVLKKVNSSGIVSIIPEKIFQALTADYTLSDVNTAQKAFNGSTNGAITLNASTTYLMQVLYLITNTGTTSHTWSTLFGGTATFTSLSYAAQSYTGTTSAATLTAVSGNYATDATALAVTAASTSATEQVVIQLIGVVRVSSGGTFIPQVKLSAATTGTEKMLKNSHITLTPIGSDTVASVGNWS